MCIKHPCMDVLKRLILIIGLRNAREGGERLSAGRRPHVCNHEYVCTVVLAAHVRRDEANLAQGREEGGRGRGGCAPGSSRGRRPAARTRCRPCPAPAACRAGPPAGWRAAGRRASARYNSARKAHMAARLAPNPNKSSSSSTLNTLLAPRLQWLPNADEQTQPMVHCSACHLC